MTTHCRRDCGKHCTLERRGPDTLDACGDGRYFPAWRYTADECPYEVVTILRTGEPERRHE